MKIEVGRYEMDLDFDPRIQNNASDAMVPIDDALYALNNTEMDYVVIEDYLFGKVK